MTSTRFALTSSETQPVANRVHANGQPGKVRVPAKGTKIAVARPVAEEIGAEEPTTQVTPNKEKKTMATTKRAAKKATKKSAAKGTKKITKAAKGRAKDNLCACGCGTYCAGTFAPGHDARLKGMLWRGEVKSPNAVQLAFAKRHSIKIGAKRPAKKTVKAAA